MSLDREPGVPDGMCMDGEGNLWIAMWGAGQILCCDPENGRVRDRLEVPDLLVSCCTFGGRDMDRLYVTTARDDTGAGGEVYEYEMQTRGVYGYRYGESEEKDGADHGRGKGNRTSDCLGDGGGRI